ncbi:hypothetical protein J6590_031454 [Homalodisca vitripennis]|nr:hypothetical protein J6590_031454 [Homalodisca vitripennis]
MYSTAEDRPRPVPGNQHAQHLTRLAVIVYRRQQLSIAGRYSTAEDRARPVPGNQHAQHLTRVNSSDSV